MNDLKIYRYLLGTADFDKDPPRRRVVPIVFADSKGKPCIEKRKESNKIERNIV